MRGLTIPSFFLTKGETMLLLDSNIFIHCDFEHIAATNEVGLTSGVLAELDAMKDGEYKRSIRKALNFILDNKIKVVQDNARLSVDDALVEAAKKYESQICTNDIAVQIKCNSNRVEWKNAPTREDFYNGITSIVLDYDTTPIYQSIVSNQTYSENPFDLLINEYIVFYDEYHKLVDVFKWSGAGYDRLESHHTVTPWNVEQRCAIDAIISDTPIKIIVGCFGSAKTYLTSTIGYDMVMRQSKYGKMVLVRNNDTGSSAEEQIGYLPGTEQDKTRNLFVPIAQYFPQGAFEMEKMMFTGMLETYITSNIKGITLSESFIIVDECEDLTITQMKRIGSRIGQNSALVFCGDSKQTEGHFKHSSGLETMIDQLKGHPLVSIVRLSQDVRSEASKLFADL